jgi:LPXTG-motif cell wall-anchored protein
MKFTTKKFGSIATAAVLAGTMAFMPMTAFATTVDSTSNLVMKTWTAASNAQLNDTETFTYELTFKNSTSQGTNTPTDFSNFGTKEVELTSNWKTSAKGGATATANLTAAQLFGETDFIAPGTYVFNLKEKAGSNPNISYSTAEYDIYVVVSWPDDYPTHTTPVIKSVMAHDAKGNKTESASFTNSAAASDSLTISKTVAGTAANTNDSFKYTLSVSGASGNYTVTKHSGTTDTTETLTAGTDYSFSLKHGESIVVANLPVGAKYTVTEADTDYEESNKIDNVASNDGLVATGTIKTGGDTVAYKNTKGFGPDTGITMNTLPFVAVGVVAVAGGAALVISRRRHAGEDF